MRQKKFSQEQIIGILKEAEKDGTVVGDVCRTHGISENSFYRWRRKYVGLDVQEARRLRELEKENARLKTIVANRDLEIEAVKELLKQIREIAEVRVPKDMGDFEAPGDASE